MKRVSLVASAFVVASMAVGADASEVREAPRIESCDDLRQYLNTRKPYERIQLVPGTYVCSEPPHISVDGLYVDFGGTLLRVADNALRPGIVVGDLQTPAQRRHKGIAVLNLRVEGNRANQAFECWGGPCDPKANADPLWAQRLNGITVNGCDDCALINVQVSGARSGGVVVVDSRRLLIDGLEAEDSFFDGLAGYVTRDSLFRNVRVRRNDFAGFSFDLGFSNNRIEDFESEGNEDHGLFIRYASGNTFVRGTFSGNTRNGVYLDRAHPDDIETCATGTRFEGVSVSGSGLYAAWLDFECGGNGFVSSRLSGNRRGCFGGLNAGLIGRSDDTDCAGPEPEAEVEAEAGVKGEG